MGTSLFRLQERGRGGLYSQRQSRGFRASETLARSVFLSFVSGAAKSHPPSVCISPHPRACGHPLRRRKRPFPSLLMKSAPNLSCDDAVAAVNMWRVRWLLLAITCAGVGALPGKIHPSQMSALTSAPAPSQNGTCNKDVLGNSTANSKADTAIGATIAVMASIISNGPRCQLKPSFMASSISCGEDVTSGTRLAA